MKKYFYMFACLFAATTLTTSCINDDDDPVVEPVVNIETDGAFILNEGNYYSNIDGSLDYLDYSTDKVTRGLFASANKRSLGNTPNDMLVGNSVLYIATNGENRIEVLNKSTMMSIKTIEIPSPREMTSDGTYVYVTSYDGRVRKIDPEYNIVVAQSAVIGDNLEGITYFGGSLYVCNSCKPGETYTYHREVVKLNASTLGNEGTISVGLNPTQIVTDGNNLYVLCMGDYDSTPAIVQRINMSNGSVNEISKATFMSIAANKLYLINAPWGATPTYHVYDIKTGSETTFTEGSEIFAPCAIAVDPIKGDAFITSYTESEYGYADYSSEGYIVHYDKNGNFISKNTTGVGPATVAFNYHYEYSQQTVK